MDEAYLVRPHVKHGGQVWVGKWSWTWSEENMKQNKDAPKQA